MRRTGTAKFGALLSIGIALAACSSQPAAKPASPATPTPVAAAVQQQVKNGCLLDLQKQASPATSTTGALHPPTVKLVRVAWLGEVRAVQLPEDAAGYELGVEYVVKLGHDDPRTGRKLCRVNLADSSVRWQAKPS